MNTETLTPSPSAGAPQSDADRFDRLKQQIADDDVLSAFIRFEQQNAIGMLDGGRFESRFTPLLCLDRRDTQSRDSQSIGSAPVAPSLPSDAAHTAHAAGPRLGWRASLLAFDRSALMSSSAAWFETIESAALLVSLDRMTRALHAVNFFASATPGLLFLPVHDRLLKSIKYDHGKHFAAILLSLGFDPARVVIEIPAAAAVHKTFLAYLVDSYRSHGFKVAANLSRAAMILSMQPGSTPNFVIADLERSRREQMIPPLLSYAQRLRTELIFDGIDDAATLAALQNDGVRYAAAPTAQRLPFSEITL